jgi:hypothetical protein
MNASDIRALREYRDKLAAAVRRANDEVNAIDADLAAFEFDNVAGNGTSSLGFSGFGDSDGPQEAA